MLSNRPGRSFVALALTAGLFLLSSLAYAQESAATPVQTGYADVNDLHMYYEIHGENTGTPAVVLHGAYMSINSMGDIIAGLAETRQVIAVELMGHGRTADVEGRPFSYEQLADDVAALMGDIGVENADIFGYSMGGGTALQLAIRHPERVNKLVLISANFNTEGMYPDVLAMIPGMTPEMFEGTPVVTDYEALAPNPEGFPTLVEKLIALDTTPLDMDTTTIASIEAPTLLIYGDSDAIRLEHAVELFHLRGGGVNGDLAGLPDSQLAVIPGATHISVLFRPDLLIPLTVDFLDSAAPAFPMG